MLQILEEAYDERPTRLSICFVSMLIQIEVALELVLLVLICIHYSSNWIFNSIDREEMHQSL